MQLTITSEPRNGRNAHNYELRRMIGVNERRLPAHVDGEFEVQGIKVHVRDQPVKGRRQHRVMATCPRCGKVVSAGRLFQHAVVHEQADLLAAIPDGAFYLAYRATRKQPLRVLDGKWWTDGAAALVGADLEPWGRYNTLYVRVRDRREGDYFYAGVPAREYRYEATAHGRRWIGASPELVIQQVERHEEVWDLRAQSVVPKKVEVAV